MRSKTVSGMLAASLLVVAACGGSPERRRLTATRAVSTPHTMPTATPPAGGPMSFDPGELFPDYRFTQTDRFWVQLDHLTRPGVTIAIGIEPRINNPDLDALRREHERQFEAPGSKRRPEHGSLESPVLGAVVWTRAGLGGEDETLQQIAVFAIHPRDQTLVVARSEFPEDSADPQAKLDELVATAEIVAPVL